MDLTLGIMIAAFLVLIGLLPIIYAKIEKQKNKKASTKKLEVIRKCIYWLSVLLFLAMAGRELLGYYSKKRDDEKEAKKEQQGLISDSTHDSKMDTGFNAVEKTIVSSKDELKSNSDSNRDSILKKLIPQTITQGSPFNKNQTNTKPLPESKNSKNNLQGSTFNGPTQVGDGNTQNIQYGLTPREVPNSLIAEVNKQVIDKNTSISISRRSGDDESFDFATKIAASLNKAGYRNAFVSGITNDQIIGGDPVAAAKHQATIAYSWDRGQFTIVIPSNK